jgi:hypothetical protein
VRRIRNQPAQISAKKRQVIVTSTHGRTGFKHMLLGSTAEYVVLPCYVSSSGRVPSHERPVLKSGSRMT